MYKRVGFVGCCPARPNIGFITYFPVKGKMNPEERIDFGGIFCYNKNKRFLRFVLCFKKEQSGTAFVFLFTVTLLFRENEVKKDG